MWLTRDKDGYGARRIVLRDRKPSFISDCFWVKGGVCEFCLKLFKKHTGISLKPGECRKIESIKITLKR